MAFPCKPCLLPLLLAAPAVAADGQPVEPVLAEARKHEAPLLDTLKALPLPARQ